MAESDLVTGEQSIIVVPYILYGDESLHRTKILIIDDDLHDVQFLERILLRVRIENFRSTTDSGTALSLFQEFQPDLVLIDWLMPECHGRTVVEQLRAMIPSGAFIPIIALTADVTSETMQLALASGADEFITKPINAFEVVLRIANTVQVRLARSGLYEQKRVLEQTVHQHTLKLRQADDELRANQQLLDQMRHLSVVGTMASGIAHDFNNTLTLIMGSGEILLRDAERQRLTEETAVPLLRDILTSAREASTLVSLLREYSKSGSTGEVHEPVNLNSLIEQVISFTKPKWDRHVSGVGCQIRMKVDLQAVPAILGNGARLRDSLINLIFNAVDAMPHGGTLTVRSRTEGEAVLLEVSDTGIGMTEEVRRSCLEPFFTTKGQGGAGLGLAMVYDTALHHSGTIDIASEPGKGTTFTLRLPASPQKSVRRDKPLLSSGGDEDPPGK